MGTYQRPPDGDMEKVIAAIGAAADSRELDDSNCLSPMGSRLQIGGDAFPTRAYLPRQAIPTDLPGMSVLDYMAGQALVGLTLEDARTGGMEPDGIAHVAYDIAEAMLTERDKRSAPRPDEDLTPYDDQDQT